MNDLSDIQKKLNDPQICPEMFFRRNHTSYELCCYVNQITGLLIGEEYDTIPIIIRRIHSYFTKPDRSESIPLEYKLLVEQYIDLVKSELDKENLLSDLGTSYLKRAGLKKKN